MEQNILQKKYKVFIIIGFLLHQSIVPKIFLVDALLNIEHSLEPKRLIHIILFLL
jgi:hypothetical protein